MRRRFRLFIYLFGVLRRFQHCTGHITTGSWKGSGNQYIQLVKVLYCKLPTSGKQLPAFPLEARPGTEPPPQRWEARVLHSATVVPAASDSRQISSVGSCFDYFFCETICRRQVKNLTKNHRDLARIPYSHESYC